MLQSPACGIYSLCGILSSVNKLEATKIISMSAEHFKDIIINCLTQQLSEFELLKSMYPSNDEIVLTDASVIKTLKTFLENKSEYTPNHLDFTVNLFISGMKLEICVNLPTLYPNEEPDIYVRCNQLNRYQESKLNLELSNYIKGNYLGEVCLYTAISWLQDNVDKLVEISDTTDLDGNTEENQSIEDKFTRLWIYSHHIYNKKKRDEIVKKAKELKLTGFSLPGKPGIVCIEGLNTNCDEWWKDIKSMCWKKIVIRKTEHFEITEQKKQQKFFTFEEIHSDMSEFSKFMEKRGLSQAFNEVFGFCNEI